MAVKPMELHWSKLQEKQPLGVWFHKALACLLLVQNLLFLEIVLSHWFKSHKDIIQKK